MIMLCLLPIFYIGVFIYMKKKKAAQKEELAKTDFQQEINNAGVYRDQWLSKKWKFLREEMKMQPIDANNYANFSYTTKDSLKDGMKDSIKSLATLGMVRYNTVQTPNYLILSGKELHFFKLEPDDSVGVHLVIDADKLRNSSISSTSLSKSELAYAKQKGDIVKGYKLTLQTNEKPLELVVFSALIFTFPYEMKANIFDSAKDNVISIAIASDFLIKLGKLYPNLKVDLEF